jgi:hypothetical protein
MSHATTHIHTCTCRGCGYELTMAVPTQGHGATFVHDMQRAGACPRCGLPLFRFIKQGPPPAPPQRATLRAVCRLLRLALHQLERAIEEHHDYSRH